MIYEKVYLVFGFWLCLGAFGLKANAAVNLIPVATMNGSSILELRPKEPVDFRIRFQDHDTGIFQTKFNMLHMKPMHMVIVKSDLSAFAHVHPSLPMSMPMPMNRTRTESMVHGEFQISLNQASTDPDNQAALNALSEPGKYYVYMEVSPDIGNVYRRPLTRTVNIEVSGNSVHQPLKETPQGAQGERVVYFGKNFRGRLLHDATPGCQSQFNRFEFSLDQWDEIKGGYLPVTNFESWLMMPGHMILISEAGQTADTKKFIHLHAEPDPLHSYLTFYGFDGGEWPVGLMKLWVQVKVMDEVLTAPFTIDYRPDLTGGC